MASSTDTGIICLAPNIRFCIAGLLHQGHFDYSLLHSTVPKTTTPAPGAANSTAPECQVSIGDIDRSLCKLESLMKFCHHFLHYTVVDCTSMSLHAD